MSLEPRDDDYPPSLEVLFDAPFVLSLAPDELVSHLELAQRDLKSSNKAKKDKWEIRLDVKNFAPEEVSVRTVDGSVVVECKHEERKDEYGFVSRQFSRRYLVPEGCEPKTVQSWLSANRVLTVSAPRGSSCLARAIEGQREVPIQRKDRRRAGASLNISAIESV